jgi:hypothetical protein
VIEYSGSEIHDQSLISRAAYYYIDDVSLRPIDPEIPDTTICLGQWITIDADTTYNHWWTSVPYDSTLMGQDTNEIVVISPIQNTTYYLYYANGCIDTFNIVIGPGPDLPVVVGHNNNCDLISSYQITNPQPDCIYFWGFSDPSYYNNNNFISFPQQGQQITVEWNQLWVAQDAQYALMYIVAYDTTTTCSTLDSMRIWKCCQKMELMDL